MTNPQEIIQQIADDNFSQLKDSNLLKGAIKRLLGIWSDRSHALIELLQNADDADATRVVYQILPDGIVLRNVY